MGFALDGVGWADESVTRPFQRKQTRIQHPGQLPQGIEHVADHGGARLKQVLQCLIHDWPFAFLVLLTLGSLLPIGGLPAPSASGAAATFTNPVPSLRNSPSATLATRGG